MLDKVVRHVLDVTLAEEHHNASPFQATAANVNSFTEAKAEPCTSEREPLLRQFRSESDPGGTVVVKVNPSTCLVSRPCP